MKPRSEYTDFEPVGYSSGSCAAIIEIAQRSDAAAVVELQNRRWAGSPDACASRWRTVTCSLPGPWKSGTRAATGSASDSVPRSTSCMVRTLVIAALVSDATS
jgi:hypothetical protein